MRWILNRLFQLFAQQSPILLKQYRYPVEKYSYELPMGSIDEGETAIAAARREFFEETGLKAKELKQIANYYAIPGLTPQQVFVFLATIEEKELKKISSKYDDEIVDVKIINFEEVKRMVKAGQIKDGFTISALSFVDLNKNAN